jgi:hypothetical protein
VPTQPGISRLVDVDQVGDPLILPGEFGVPSVVVPDVEPDVRHGDADVDAQFQRGGTGQDVRIERSLRDRGEGAFQLGADVVVEQAGVVSRDNPADQAGPVQPTVEVSGIM